MAQRGLGGSGGSFGGFRGSCCLLEGSEDVPEVSWVSKGCSCGSGGSWSHPEGLGMSQGGLGGSGGSFGGFRGSCCLLEGSEDVPEVSWGVQRVLMWVWGAMEPSRKFGGVPQRPWRVQGVLLLIHGVHGFIQKCLEMSKKVPVQGGPQVCPGHPCSHPEGSGDGPERTWRVWGVLWWVQRVLLCSGRV